MKKVIAAIFVLGAVGILVLGFLPSNNGASPANDFLRLHIRANSNSNADQAVKHQVRAAVIDEFTPIFSTITTREQAMGVLSSNVSRLQTLANDILREAGKNYTARVALRSEFFPTRAYNDVVLPEGYYDALIIELGAAAGDNWWCVIYPPLCFLQNNIGGERGVVYRSRLQEIIRRWF